MNKEPNTHGQSKIHGGAIHDDYIYIITHWGAFVKPLKRKTREIFTGFSFCGKDDITFCLYSAAYVCIYYNSPGADCQGV